MHEEVFSELNDSRKSFRTFLTAINGAANMHFLKMLD